MEGVAAIAIVFVLFTVMAQAATALLAHRTAQAAVAATAARVAVLPSAAAVEKSRLQADLERIVPGAGPVTIDVELAGRVVRTSASFEFRPPGPVFRSIQMEVSADAPIVVEP